MIDINESAFEAEVLQASFEQPVLVDFWAPWCGPCRALGPLLEKIERDLSGRVKLVKINSDDNQQLSSRYQVRSIPFVMLFRDGQAVDSFVGVRAESQIRSFIEGHLPRPGDDQLREAREAAAAGKLDDAAQRFATVLAINPAQDEVRVEYVQLLIRLGRYGDAVPAFEPLRQATRSDLAVAALAQRLEAAIALGSLGSNVDAERLLRAEVDASDSLPARFRLAQWLLLHARWQPAMEELLLIISRDRRFNDDAARKAMLAIFQLCEDAALVGTYRRKLSAALN